RLRPALPALAHPLALGLGCRNIFECIFHCASLSWAGWWRRLSPILPRASSGACHSHSCRCSNKLDRKFRWRNAAAVTKRERNKIGNFG
ncbi:unnamed protein product, partial [Heterosigma akashiwo]